jgi:hypothetical protein
MKMVPQPRDKPLLSLGPSKLEPSLPVPVAQISRLAEACPWIPTGKESTAQVVVWAQPSIVEPVEVRTNTQTYRYRETYPS